MPTTPTWALPYPAPTDAPCALPAVLDQLAARLDTVLGAIAADQATLGRPPTAVASYQSSTPQAISNTNRIVQFNTVEQDNAGMIDLGRQADRILLPRAGYWSVGAHLIGTNNSPGSYAGLVLNVANGASVVQFDDTDRDGAPADGELYSIGGLAQVTTPAAAWVDVRLGLNPITITFTTAVLWATWIADL